MCLSSFSSFSSSFHHSLSFRAYSCAPPQNGHPLLHQNAYGTASLSSFSLSSRLHWRMQNFHYISSNTLYPLPLREWDLLPLLLNAARSIHECVSGAVYYNCTPSDTAVIISSYFCVMIFNDDSTVDKWILISIYVAE